MRRRQRFAELNRLAEERARRPPPAAIDPLTCPKCGRKFKMLMHLGRHRSNCNGNPG